MREFLTPGELHQMNTADISRALAPLRHRGYRLPVTGRPLGPAAFFLLAAAAVAGGGGGLTQRSGRECGAAAALAADIPAAPAGLPGAPGRRTSPRRRACDHEAWTSK